MTETELQQAPVSAPNKKGEDFQPASGQNIAALKQVYSNFLYLRNSLYICLALIGETLTIHITQVSLNQ